MSADIANVITACFKGLRSSGSVPIKGMLPGKYPPVTAVNSGSFHVTSIFLIVVCLGVGCTGDQFRIFAPEAILPAHTVNQSDV